MGIHEYEIFQEQSPSGAFIFEFCSFDETSSRGIPP